MRGTCYYHFAAFRAMEHSNCCCIVWWQRWIEGTFIPHFAPLSACSLYMGGNAQIPWFCPHISIQDIAILYKYCRSCLYLGGANRNCGMWASHEPPASITLCAAKKPHLPSSRWFRRVRISLERQIPIPPIRRDRRTR